MRKYLRLFSVAWTLTKFGFPLFLDQFTIRGARPDTNRPTLVVANHATHVDPETVIMVLKEYDVRFFAASTLFPGLLMNQRKTWYGKIFERSVTKNPDHPLIQRLLGKNSEAILAMSHDERLLACELALRLGLYESLNMIPVHRNEDGLGGSKHQRENLKRFKAESAKAVRQSSRLVIFPEGEVDNQWNVAELKEGASKLAEYMVEEYQT
jgi:1-acyl-sn-glycerol-3-phosphate acyltransferase